MRGIACLWHPIRIRIGFIPPHEVAENVAYENLAHPVRFGKARHQVPDIPDRPVELLGYLPIVERLDSHTVRFVGKDMVEVSKFLEFMLSYEVSLQP